MFDRNPTTQHHQDHFPQGKVRNRVDVQPLSQTSVLYATTVPSDSSKKWLEIAKVMSSTPIHSEKKFNQHIMRQGAMTMRGPHRL